MSRKIARIYDTGTLKFAKGNLAVGDQLNPKCYPELYNLSAAFIFDFAPSPKKAFKPEFVYVPIDFEN